MFSSLRWPSALEARGGLMMRIRRWCGWHVRRNQSKYFSVLSALLRDDICGFSSSDLCYASGTWPCIEGCSTFFV
ncbi:hypothetical protein CEXT_560291 [Caerostris extrusa]|uniref:Uncharacterized protein n=1 Tax=Caerostris extrusa TaxID=172846 RepID=A0AAV4MI83_CAEEX|nr:hypothetical protein CEXT_560291 [Caerostris extrusa]